MSILEPEKDVYDIRQCEHVLYHLIASDQMLAYVHPAFPQWEEAEAVPEEEDLLKQVQSDVTLLVSEGIDMDVHIAIADKVIPFPRVEGNPAASSQPKKLSKVRVGEEQFNCPHCGEELWSKESGVEPIGSCKHLLYTYWDVEGVYGFISPSVRSVLPLNGNKEGALEGGELPEDDDLLGKVGADVTVYEVEDGTSGSTHIAIS